MSSPEQNYFFRFAMRYPVIGKQEAQKLKFATIKTNLDYFDFWTGVRELKNSS